uniref:Uncharacterized protein n=1 Tax=Leersia perrieri TaxID=77586 RepID=A0A0D9VCK4_9ORYZ
MDGGGGDDYDGHRMAALELGGAAAADQPPLIPFFRSRTIRAAVFFIMWGFASITLGAVPELSIGLAHLILCFFFLIAGIALLTLAVAGPRSGVAARAAAALESWLRFDPIDQNPRLIVQIKLAYFKGKKYAGSS